MFVFVGPTSNHSINTTSTGSLTAGIAVFASSTLCDVGHDLGARYSTAIQQNGNTLGGRGRYFLNRKISGHVGGDRASTKVYTQAYQQVNTSRLDINEANFLTSSGMHSLKLADESELVSFKYNPTALGLPAGVYLVNVTIGKDVYKHRVRFF